MAIEKEKKAHVFNRNVQHNRRDFVKGNKCPSEIHDDMLAKGFIEPVTEAIKPTEPAPAQPVVANTAKEPEKS